MMILVMLAKMCSLCEASLTFVTVVWLGVRMTGQVLLQVNHLHELLAAEFALIWPLPRVPTHVGFQVSILREGLFTDVTYIRFES